MDRRRRALSRYLTYAANHHLLRNDHAVRVFLEEEVVSCAIARERTDSRGYTHVAVQG